MLQREAELRNHPSTQRALDRIELNSQDVFQLRDDSADKNNCVVIDDEQYEIIFRRAARMKSGELKAQLRQLGLMAKGPTATLRYESFASEIVHVADKCRYGMQTQQHACCTQVSTAERGPKAVSL